MSLRSGPPTFVCAKLPMEAFQSNPSICNIYGQWSPGPSNNKMLMDGSETLPLFSLFNCFWNYIQPKQSFQFNISDFSDSRHFKHVHSPLFLTSITSILSKRSRTFLGPWVLHHLSWLYKQQARCVPIRVMGRSVDGGGVWTPWSSRGRGSYKGSDPEEAPGKWWRSNGFFLCQGDFLPSKNPFNF